MCPMFSRHSHGVIIRPSVNDNELIADCRGIIKHVPYLRFCVPHDHRQGPPNLRGLPGLSLGCHHAGTSPRRPQQNRRRPLPATIGQSNARNHPSLTLQKSAVQPPSEGSPWSVQHSIASLDAQDSAIRVHRLPAVSRLRIRHRHDRTESGQWQDSVALHITAQLRRTPFLAAEGLWLPPIGHRRSAYRRRYAVQRLREQNGH